MENRASSSACPAEPAARRRPSVDLGEGPLEVSARGAHAAAAGVRTDDAGLVEALGGAVVTVPGYDAAFKITRPLDLVLAEAVLAAAAGAGQAHGH